MAFWGPSKAMNNAVGQIDEMSRWNKAQYQEWLNNAKNFTQQGGDNLNWGRNYLMDRATNGIGNPDQVRDTGRWITPGVDEAIASRSGRLDQIGRDFQGTRGFVDGNYDTIAGGLADNYGAIQDTLGRTYGISDTRANNTNRDITNNIRETYGRAQGAAGDAYLGLRRDSYGTFDQMNQDAGGAYGKAGGSIAGGYDEAARTIDMLNPAGDFAAAKAARAFTPMKAQAQRQLRASGIDPNSAEAAEFTSRVDTAQARAMDDSFAGAADRYVGMKSGLAVDRGNREAGLELDRFGTQAGIARDRLSNNQGLVTRANDIDTELTLGAGRDYQNETRRNQAVKDSLDYQFANDSNANRDLSYTRGADIHRERNQNAMNMWGVGAGLGRERNQEDINAIDMRNSQFDRGLGFLNNDAAIRDRAAGGVTQIGQTQLGTGLQAGNLARGYGNDAVGNNQQVYGIEAPNAGWGTKLLGGIATAGLNAIAPGMGTMVGGMIPGKKKQPSYGGGWGGSENPYAFY